MNLLPKSHHEFNQTEYWNTFFKKRGEKAFEWYGEYLELCDQLHKYIKSKDKILMVGCGNSKLSMDMYDSGFKEITNIDISQVAIKKMIEINQRTRASMKFLHMDATEMSFPDEEFSVVLDKGTLDALMTDDSEEVRSTVEKYFNEICRVLKNGGRYVIISLLQEHILKFLLEYFPQHSCMFRVTRCFDAEQKTAENSSEALAMPVFVVVVTKFKTLPTPILEVCFGGDKMNRLNSTAELIEGVSSIQKAALVCNGLAKSSIADLNEVSIDLYKPDSNIPRYTVYILDQPPARGNGKYGAFIVPQGRETDWFFSTPLGRKKLLASAQQNRLAIVTMHRDQEYTSWDAVKSELADSIRNFAPHGLKEQIPYLSLGTDVGKRETLVSGSSQISGDFRIEEVEGRDGKLFRRLIFLCNQFAIQSEALVNTIKPKGKKPRKKIDVGYLACQHHLFMTVGAQMATSAPSKDINDVLVIGLGGGGMCTFMRQALPHVRVTAVDIDPIMLEIAEQYFDLKQDERLHVVIDDGLSFIEKCKNDEIHFKAVLFDVDSKDISVGLACPPKSFLDTQVMENVKHVIGNSGLFVLNFVCRNETLRDEVVLNLRTSFKSVCCYKLVEDINEVIYCSNNEKFQGIEDWKKAFGTSGRSLNNLIKETKLAKTDMVDVSDFLKELKI